MLPFSMSFVDDLETLEGIQIHPAVKCHPRVLKKGAKNIILPWENIIKYLR